MTEKLFSFGKNWNNYVARSLNEDRIEEARQSLLNYLPQKEYTGKTFLDIGCGSGIFSFNAARLGCNRVVSFDIDPFSIVATKYIKGKFVHLLPVGIDWKIFEASILDPDLKKKVGTGDIVYSWGVLHHTGNMKEAIKNAAGLVNPGGWFVIAIYNRAPSSLNWFRVKRFYNRTNWFIKQIMTLLVFFYTICDRLIYNAKLLYHHLPIEPIFTSKRGMSMYYDIIDWLGGYPYEFMTWEELKDMIEPLGFRLMSSPVKIPSFPNIFRNRWSFTATGNNVLIFKENHG